MSRDERYVYVDKLHNTTIMISSKCADVSKGLYCLLMFQQFVMEGAQLNFLLQEISQGNVTILLFYS